MRLPRPEITDPGLSALKSAARAAIVIPAAFAVASQVIQDLAAGFAVSLGVGLVFWPRGAATARRENMATAYSRDMLRKLEAHLSGQAFQVLGSDRARRG